MSYSTRWLPRSALTLMSVVLLRSRSISARAARPTQTDHALRDTLGLDPRSRRCSSGREPEPASLWRPGHVGSVQSDDRCLLGAPFAPACDGSTPAVLLAPSQLFNRSRRTTGMCGLRAASPAASAASRPADDGPRPPCSTTAQEECSGCTCEQSTRAIASWPSGRTVPTSQAQRSG